MLTPEEMEQIPDMELPEVPKELLRNFLTQSRAIRKEGVLGWEVKQQRNGTSRTCFLPLLKSRQIGSVTFWYQVNPTIGTYEMRTEPEELTMETEPILLHAPGKASVCASKASCAANSVPGNGERV